MLRRRCTRAKLLRQPDKRQRLALATLQQAGCGFGQCEQPGEHQKVEQQQLTQSVRQCSEQAVDEGRYHRPLGEHQESAHKHQGEDQWHQPVFLAGANEGPEITKKLEKCMHTFG